MLVRPNSQVLPKPGISPVQRPKPSKTETEYVVIAPMLYAEDVKW